MANDLIRLLDRLERAVRTDAGKLPLHDLLRNEPLAKPLAALGAFCESFFSRLSHTSNCTE
jgi:hypothetical protein